LKIKPEILSINNKTSGNLVAPLFEVRPASFVAS